MMLKLKLKYILLTSLVFMGFVWFGCNKEVAEEVVDFMQNNCKKPSDYIKPVTGFAPQKCYYSGQERRKMGLWLVEKTGEEPNASYRYYQHESWKQAGSVGPFTIDEMGGVYVGPAPFINVLENKFPDVNTIYKVDNNSGEMKEFIRLPMPDTADKNNPYGIIGLIYMCETRTLFVSTIAGSDRKNERGAIYAIDIESGKVIDCIRGIDAMGMGINYVKNRRELYFGNGRDSDIYVVEISSKGAFKGLPKKEFTISGLGPRGDDKVRRIKTDKNGNLEVYGLEFNYNLIAPSEKQETVYVFGYYPDNGGWLFSGIKPNA